MGQEIFTTTFELLERAAEAGVFLSYTSDGLQFKLAADVFPEALKSEIVANKPALIEFLRQRQLDESTFSRPTIRAFDRTLQKAPLSFAQQRLWFIDQFDGGSRQYNMPAAMRIRGHLTRTSPSILCGASSNAMSLCVPPSLTGKTHRYSRFRHHSIFI